MSTTLWEMKVCCVNVNKMVQNNGHFRIVLSRLITIQLAALISLRTHCKLLTSSNNSFYVHFFFNLFPSIPRPIPFSPFSTTCFSFKRSRSSSTHRTSPISWTRSSSASWAFPFSRTRSSSTFGSLIRTSARVSTFFRTRTFPFVRSSRSLVLRTRWL